MVKISSTNLLSDANILGAWNLATNSNDSVGSNNGTDTSITYSSQNKKYDGVAYFNGTSSYIDVTNGINLTGDFTLAGWVFPQVSYPDTQYRIFLAKDNTGQRQFTAGLTDTGHAYFERAGTAILNSGAGTSGAVANPYSWTHMVFTYNSTTITSYMSGVSNISNAMSTLPSATSNVTFGKRLIDGIYFKGGLENWAIFNRVLTDAEITLLAKDPLITRNMYLKQGFQ